MCNIFRKYVLPLVGLRCIVYPWKGGMSAHMEETFFCPKKGGGVSLTRGGVCLPLAKAGPSLEQQEGGQAGGGTHISINLPKAI